ncbi:unnamed protein product, partial [Polarella glacialis]
EFRGFCSACAWSPCMNNATCQDQVGFKYNCTCATGWTGQNCTDSIFANSSNSSGGRRLGGNASAVADLCNLKVQTAYPEGKYWCRCRGGAKVPIETSVRDIIRSWGIFFNYVTNFNHSYVDMTCSDSSSTVKTPTSRIPFATSAKTGMAPNASSNVISIEQKFYGTGFPKSPPFYVLLSGLAGYERALVTSIQEPSLTSIDPFQLIVVRGMDGAQRLKFDTTMPGDPAPTPNDNWVCHAKLYNDGRTCDCRCGLPDPDCLFPNLPVKNCGSEEVCSAVGRCTTPEASAGLTDTSSVYISEP